MRNITKRSAGVITAAVVAVGGAGSAWAAWSLTGSGDTTATASTVVPLEIGTVKVVGLSPGIASDVQFNLINKNKFAVKLTDVTITGIKAPAGSACPEGNVAKQTFPLPADATVGPAASGPAQKLITLPGAVKMNATAGDNCQGAIFTVSLGLKGATAAA